MDSKTTSQRVYPGASCAARHTAECDQTPRLKRDETLILVLSLSLGLGAVIWGGVLLLGVYGLR